MMRWLRGSWGILLLGPLVGLLVGLLAWLLGLQASMSKTLGIGAFMVTWWVEGSIKMGLTGLLPIVLLPLFGIVSGSQVSKVYFSDTVVVCLGSLLMSQAVELYSLHLIAACHLLRYSGQFGAAGVVGAFVFITGFISMWLSNTATAALMIPLSNAVFTTLLTNPTILNGISPSRVGAAMDIAIAFAASLGGIATLTGTGANLVLQGTISTTFGSEGQDLTFLTWFVAAAPYSLLNLCALWAVLCMYVWSWPSLGVLRRAFQRASHYRDGTVPSAHSGPSIIENTPSALHDRHEIPDISTDTPSIAGDSNSEPPPVGVAIQLPPMPKMTYPAKVVIMAFVLMALFWITRDPPGDWGWAVWLGCRDQATDGTVALGVCLVLLLLPTEPPPCRWNCSRFASSLGPRHSYAHASESEHGMESEVDEVELAATSNTVIVTSPSGYNPDLWQPTHMHDTILTPSEPSSLPSSSPAEEQSSTQYSTILPWKAVKNLHWDILFLLGGGLALSLGFQECGLSDWMASMITSSGVQNVHQLTAIAAAVACVITNVMSNVAAANVFLPLLACLGPRYGQDPLYVLFPVTISLSLALCLPLGTPPNAIVVSNGRVSVSLLFKLGSLCTVIHFAVLLLYCATCFPNLYGHRHASQQALDRCAS